MSAQVVAFTPVNGKLTTKLAMADEQVRLFVFACS